MERARQALAGLSLVVLAVSLVSPLDRDATVARARRFAAAVSGEPGYRSDRMSFWFDPEYAAFLEDVRRRTPESATVAVLVPRRPDLYKYQAYYRLAPRRVVEERWLGEADVVATYRTETARGPGGIEIAGGRLWTR
jgi:hypothetical protein